jgi:DNA-binding transcriptional MerR regulator
MNPTSTDELTKLYYTIGEVADLLGVNSSMIRFWENEFSSLKPHKNSKGDRRFTKANIEQLQLIQYLLKERGFTLEGAKKELKESKIRQVHKQKTIETLLALKKKLLHLKEEL